MKVVMFLLFFGIGVKGHPRRDRVVHILDASLYNGDKIDEFLNLCTYPHNSAIQPNDFESYFAHTMGPKPSERRCAVLDVGIHDGMSFEDEKKHIRARFHDLRHAQDVVRDYHQVLITPDFYPLLGILIFIILGGTYLIVVGHYDWRSIFDEYYADDSHGVPCWQYIRMRYVAAKVRNNTKNKTLLVPIFDKGVKEEKKEDKKEEKGKKD